MKGAEIPEIRQLAVQPSTWTGLAPHGTTQAPVTSKLLRLPTAQLQLSAQTNQPTHSHLHLAQLQNFPTINDPPQTHSTQQTTQSSTPTPLGHSILTLTSTPTLPLALTHQTTSLLLDEKTSSTITELSNHPCTIPNLPLELQNQHSGGTTIQSHSYLPTPFQYIHHNLAPQTTTSKALEGITIRGSVSGAPKQYLKKFKRLGNHNRKATILKSKKVINPDENGKRAFSLVDDKELPDDMTLSKVKKLKGGIQKSDQKMELQVEVASLEWAQVSQ